MQKVHVGRFQKPDEQHMIINSIMQSVVFASPIVNANLGQVEPFAEYLRDGMFAYADGENWNPAGGKGFYRYDTNSASWLPIGVMARPLTSKTANYTATTYDSIILVSASGGSVTITLPTAVGIKGKEFTIKKTDSSANIVTVDGNGSETIDGDTTRDLALQYEAIDIISDNASWWII